VTRARRSPWPTAVAVAVLLAIAPPLARAAAAATAAAVEDSLEDVAIEALLSGTRWPFSAEMPAPPPPAGTPAMSAAEVDAVFAWARGPAVGLLTAPFDSLIAPPHRARLAAVFRRLRQHGEYLALLRDTRAQQIAALRQRGLLAEAEARVFGRPTVTPLLVWYQLEDLTAASDTLPVTRERVPAMIERLHVYATLSAQASRFVGDTARRWADLDRRVAALPLVRRMKFADRFMIEFDRLRTERFGDRGIEFETRSPRWRLLAPELGAALERILDQQDSR
jgi:hypothetical protein